jgi:hypothetical protein
MNHHDVHGDDLAMNDPSILIEEADLSEKAGARPIGGRPLFRRRVVIEARRWLLGPGPPRETRQAAFDVDRFGLRSRFGASQSVSARMYSS